MAVLLIVIRPQSFPYKTQIRVSIIKSETQYARSMLYFGIIVEITLRIRWFQSFPIQVSICFIPGPAKVNICQYFKTLVSGN